MWSLFILVSVLLALVYLFIPSEIKVTKEFIVKARLATVSRNLFAAEKWNNWLPYQSNNSLPKSHSINKTEFANIKYISENTGIVDIINTNYKTSSSILLVALKTDSTIINWSCTITTTSNPLSRLRAYFNATSIKESIDAVAKSFETYITDLKKVYGFATKITTLQDSSMISTKGETFQYPSVTDIYAKIEKLEQYAANRNATATNFPMLNIQKVSEKNYRFMVALPINKRLENSGDISYKQMLPNGNFLCSDSIYGGFSKLDNLFVQFENYRKDLNLMSPAIPFQSLITDRRREADTTKWITKFYYPIF